MLLILVVHRAAFEFFKLKQIPQRSVVPGEFRNCYSINHFVVLDGSAISMIHPGYMDLMDISSSHKSKSENFDKLKSSVSVVYTAFGPNFWARVARVDTLLIYQRIGDIQKVSDFEKFLTLN